MWNRVLLMLFILWCALCGLPMQSAWSQQLLRGLVEPTAAARAGLTRAWWTAVEMDTARGRIGAAAMGLNHDRTITIFAVESGGRRVYFSERMPGAAGQMLGVTGAERQAQNLIETYKGLGRKYTLEKLAAAEFTLYVQTTRGGLHAIDGQTGRTRWAVQVGNPELPTMPPGASDRFAAMVNGTQLYLLQAEDGRHQWQRPLNGVPVAGPAVGANMVFVPTLGGAMEAYPVEDGKSTPTIYRGAGSITARATVSPLSVSWPTDAGFLYLGLADRLSPRTRLEARDPIVSSTARQAPGLLFAATIGGHVYCLDENHGNVLWDIGLGEPVSQSPVPIGDSLYIVTDHAGMHSLSSKTGEERWRVRGIQRFIASSHQRVYCMTGGQTLAVLDVRSGALLGGIRAPDLDLVATNWQTDRLYLGNRNGTIQCLHEASLDWPVYHVQKEAEPGENAGPQTEGTTPNTPPAQPPTTLDASPADALGPFTEPAGQPPADGIDPFAQEPAGELAQPPAGPADGARPAPGDAGQPDPFGELNAEELFQ